MKAPNSKLQAPEKHQEPSSNYGRTRLWMFGAWNFSGAWRLVLGAFSIRAGSLPFLLMTLFALSVGMPQCRAQAFKESDLKAAFLYNFAQFAEWPPEAFPSAETSFVIGVLGADP